jgi:hypothetical protein
MVVLATTNQQQQHRTTMDWIGLDWIGLDLATEVDT